MKLLPVIVTSVVLVSGLVSGAIAPSDGQHVASARRHTGIPSVAACGDRLWVTYYGGPTGGEDSNNYCVLTTSTDGGRTWKDVLVSDPDATVRNGRSIPRCGCRLTSGFRRRSPDELILTKQV